MGTSVILEAATKRSFASAVDWPGWARGGRTADAAVEALLAAAPRYATVAQRAGLAFLAPRSVEELEIVERVAGGGGTEFGVPSVPASAEAAPVSPAELDRMVRLLEASWATFDDVARAAEGRALATGPRGGGRSLEAIRGHVRDAEVAYVGQLGAKTRDPEASRATFLATLRAVVHGDPIQHPRRTRKPWPPRYAVRRAAWHVLDHAWEIEDRAS